MFPRSIRKSFFAAAAALVFASSLTAAQTAPIVSYQGLLTSTAGAPLADAEYQVTFRLYSGSTEVWKESQKLKTAHGLFAAALGSVNPFTTDFFTKNPSLQLSVQVGSETEYPKTALNMTPYAASANVADSALKSGAADIAKQTFGSGIIGAVETDKVIARTDAGLTLVNKAGQGIVVDKSGNVGVGTVVPTAKLEVAGDLKVSGNIITSGSVNGKSQLSGSIDIPANGVFYLPVIGYDDIADYYIRSETAAFHSTVKLTVATTFGHGTVAGIANHFGGNAAIRKVEIIRGGVYDKQCLKITMGPLAADGVAHYVRVAANSPFNFMESAAPTASRPTGVGSLGPINLDFDNPVGLDISTTNGKFDFNW